MTEEVQHYGVPLTGPATTAPQTLAKRLASAGDLLLAAQIYVVDSDAMYECAAADLRAVKALQKDLDSTDLEMAESILQETITRWLDAKEAARNAARAITAGGAQ